MSSKANEFSHKAMRFLLDGQRQRHERDMREYAALVGSPTELADTKLARLDELAAALGKTPEQVREDILAIDEARQLQARIDAAAKNESAKDAALGAWEASKAETARIIQERRSADFKAQTAYDEAEATHRASMDAVTRLPSLRKRFEELFLSLAK